MRPAAAPLLVACIVLASVAPAAHAAAPLSMAGVTVAIDPGHNPGNGRHASRIARLVDAGTLRKPCDTVGTRQPGGISEATLTLRIANLVATRLRAQGAEVILTHDGTTPPWGPCITDRARIGNAADVAISLHADGATGSGARGFHVIRPARVRGLTDDIDAASATLATKVRWHVGRRTALPHSTYAGVRGIDVRSDIGGLNHSDVPKVLLEMGNMRSSRDMRVLGSARGQQRMAYAVADAIAGFASAD